MCVCVFSVPCETRVLCTCHSTCSVTGSVALGRNKLNKTKQNKKKEKKLTVTESQHTVACLVLAVLGGCQFVARHNNSLNISIKELINYVLN